MANRNLASKGRYGDTEIRKVAGRKSHVNKGEAKAIDLYGKLGERLVQKKGAGTRNPKTGLPEYWEWWEKNVADPLQEHVFDPLAEFTGTTGMNLGEATINVMSGKTVDISGQDQGSLINVDAGEMVYGDDGGGGDTGGTEWSGDFDKNEYMQHLNAGTGDDYLREIGIKEEDIPYFESNINKDYLGAGGFLERGKELTEAGAAQTEEEASAAYGLGMEQAGTGARRSLFDIKQQTDVAASKSGFASSGGIAAIGKRAQKGVFQDYTMQQKQLAEAKSSAFGRADLTRQGAQLSYETGISDIGQTAGQEFWANLEEREYYD